MDKITKLLQGAVDLHCHSGPGLIPRSLDHAEAVKQALAVGMRGLVVSRRKAARVVALRGGTSRSGEAHQDRRTR